jgi:hypothetical protein
MTDPHDPNSIPMLTDVIVPGRPSIGRPGETQAHGAPETSSAPRSAFAPAPQAESHPTSEPGAYTPPVASTGAAPVFDARDVEFIAERLRGRFASYLRQDARAVVEARCRDAIEEHTNWLVRQVTREVLGALEQEIGHWVRDAVSEELARHTSRR